MLHSINPKARINKKHQNLFSVSDIHAKATRREAIVSFRLDRFFIDNRYRDVHFAIKYKHIVPRASPRVSFMAQWTDGKRGQVIRLGKEFLDFSSEKIQEKSESVWPGNKAKSEI